MVSDAQRKANLKWDNANKERKQYLNKRSVTRNFLKKSATAEDLQEMKQIIIEREKDLV